MYCMVYCIVFLLIPRGRGEPRSTALPPGTWLQAAESAAAEKALRTWMHSVGTVSPSIVFPHDPLQVAKSAAAEKALRTWMRSRDMQKDGSIRERGTLLEMKKLDTALRLKQHFDRLHDPDTATTPAAPSHATPSTVRPHPRHLRMCPPSTVCQPYATLYGLPQSPPTPATASTEPCDTLYGTPLPPLPSAGVGFRCSNLACNSLCGTLLHTVFLSAPAGILDNDFDGIAPQCLLDFLRDSFHEGWRGDLKAPLFTAYRELCQLAVAKAGARKDYACVGSLLDVTGGIFFRSRLGVKDYLRRTLGEHDMWHRKEYVPGSRRVTICGVLLSFEVMITLVCKPSKQLWFLTTFLKQGVQ